MEKRYTRVPGANTSKSFFFCSLPDSSSSSSSLSTLSSSSSLGAGFDLEGPIQIKQFAFYRVMFTQYNNKRLPVPLLKLGFFLCFLFPFTFSFVFFLLVLRLRADFQFESILRMCSSNMADSLMVIEYICANSRI